MEDLNVLGRLFNRLPSPPVNLLSTIVALIAGYSGGVAGV